MSTALPLPAPECPACDSSPCICIPCRACDSPLDADGLCVRCLGRDYYEGRPAQARDDQ